MIDPAVKLSISLCLVTEAPNLGLSRLGSDFIRIIVGQIPKCHPVGLGATCVGQNGIRQYIRT